MRVVGRLNARPTRCRVEIFEGSVHRSGLDYLERAGLAVGINSACGSAEDADVRGHLMVVVNVALPWLVGEASINRDVRREPLLTTVVSNLFDLDTFLVAHGCSPMKWANKKSV